MRGCAGGHHWKRGSAVMSGVRYGSVSDSMAASRPWVRGSGPIRSMSSSLMPTVTNLANRSPSGSGTPIAA